jgi:hypothetical protein
VKQSYYFPHDFHARHDPKLERLRMEIGPISDGIFWDLVEMLYEEGGYLLIADIPVYAKMLNTDEHMLNKCINILFLKDGDRFYNQSLLDRLNHLQNVIDKRSLAGKKSANVRKMNTCSTSVEHLSNTIKEIKEIKERDIKDIGARFNEFWELYPKQVGMSMALITFKATVKTDKDFEDLKSALKNYTGSPEYKKGMIKNGDRWIEDWRGWLKLGKKTGIERYEVTK